MSSKKNEFIFCNLDLGMMRSWHGKTFRIMGPLCSRGIHRWPLDSPHKRTIMNFLVVSILSLDTLLNKQSNDQWFETPWCSCNVTVMGHLLTLRSQSCWSPWPVYQRWGNPAEQTRRRWWRTSPRSPPDPWHSAPASMTAASSSCWNWCI